MASPMDLKRQIRAIQNTAKVTEALQTVSGVKFRKAEARVKKARPYAENVEQMMRDIAASATGRNPLLAGREVNTIAVATLAADRGLAGAFNAQVLRRTMQFRRERERDAELLQITSGRKAAGFFRFRRIGLTEQYSGFSDNPGHEDARKIGQRLTRLFEDEEADEVYLIYNRFQSALVQNPTVTRLLPVAPEGSSDGGEERGGGDRDGASAIPFDYIPGPEEVLERLVPRYVETLVYRALLESAAGEHGARMTAMKSATDNANEMSDRLTLEMNKARQAQITREIIEIAAGAEALAAG